MMMTEFVSEIETLIINIQFQHSIDFFHHKHGAKNNTQYSKKKYILIHGEEVLQSGGAKLINARYAQTKTT